MDGGDIVVFAHSHQDPALFVIKTHRTQRQQEYKKSFREMLKSETGGTAKTAATVYDVGYRKSFTIQNMSSLVQPVQQPTSDPDLTIFQKGQVMFLFKSNVYYYH